MSSQAFLGRSVVGAQTDLFLGSADRQCLSLVALAAHFNRLTAAAKCLHQTADRAAVVKWVGFRRM
jgi:hypothetical protein